MWKSDGGPAFPRSVSIEPSGNVAYANKGMTLRDYFAAAALQLLMIRAAAEPNEIQDVVDMYVTDLARGSYKIADAMILERDKQ